MTEPGTHPGVSHVEPWKLADRRLPLSLYSPPYSSNINTRHHFPGPSGHHTLLLVFAALQVKRPQPRCTDKGVSKAMEPISTVLDSEARLSSSEVAHRTHAIGTPSSAPGMAGLQLGTCKVPAIQKVCVGSGV